MKTNLLLQALFLLMSINSFAQLNCYQEDSQLHQYYAKLDYVANMPTTFEKGDFISYVTNHLSLNNDNVSTLNEDLIAVTKSFPSTQSPLLQNVVSVDSTSDIFPLISTSNTAISIIECRSNPILLKIKDSDLESLKVSVSKNPIDETSKLIINSKNKQFDLEISNSIGQKIYNNQINNQQPIYLNSLIKESGLYIITVKDLANNKSYSIKTIK